MRRLTATICLLLLGAASAAAQMHRNVPNAADMYCSGIITTEKVPYDTYLISGEESYVKTTFSQWDYVYINRGGEQGVKVGDEFLVTRPIKDPNKVEWFVYQPDILREIGTMWKDLGRIRVVVVHPKVSIAQVIYACDYLARGDYVRPFEERPAPQLKVVDRFDRFTPESGKQVAMVVSSRDFRSSLGRNEVAYVNLGSAQGVKVGDYLRFFRWQGTRHETVYRARQMAYSIFGFGRTPVRYGWKDLPREILGEGVVLRVGPNSATVLITYSLREIWLGDYGEIE